MGKTYSGLDAQKAIATFFDGGQVYPKNDVLVNASHTVAGTNLSGAMSPVTLEEFGIRTEKKKFKHPRIKKKKTMAMLDVDYLEKCLKILKTNNCEAVAIKLVVVPDYPVELIGIRDGNDWTKFPRLLLAPRIESDISEDTIAKELGTRRKKTDAETSV